jgi:hypothetical protein
MSLVGLLFWSILIVGGIPVAGALLVRRWVISTARSRGWEPAIGRLTDHSPEEPRTTR